MQRPNAPGFALLALGPSSLAVLCVLFFAAACDNEGERTEDRPLDEPENALKAGTVSCATRSDTGYDRGSAFQIQVMHVDGKPVELNTGAAYWKMQQDAARQGIYLRVISGFRTQGEQQYLYSCYTSCSCNNCNLAAYPGYSNHQSGYALDLNTHENGVLWWLNNNASRYGFRRTVPSEDWHWEYFGGAVANGPCSGGGAGGRADSSGESSGGGNGTYTVEWGGSCWEAAQQLGCSSGSLVNCSASRGCASLWAGDELACSQAACDGGAPAGSSAGGSASNGGSSNGEGGGSTYTIPSGGSCWEAGQALGCSTWSLVNCTANRGCASLQAGDRLACSESDCSGGTSSSVGGPSGSGSASNAGQCSTYSVPSGGGCGAAAASLGCGQGSLVNCSMPDAGCHDLWSGDVLACSANCCP